jgi:hypothetical protein
LESVSNGGKLQTTYLSVMNAVKGVDDVNQHQPPHCQKHER